MKEKGTKVFYNNWSGVFKDLSDAEAKRLIIALLDYTPNKDDIDDIFPIGDSLRTTFRPMMEAINANHSKWEESHRRRQEAGRNGGIQKALNAKAGKTGNGDYFCPWTDENSVELLDTEDKYELGFGS